MSNINLVLDDLKKSGKITDEQLEAAKKESKKTGLPFDKVLMRNGVIAEDTIAIYTSKKLGVPYIDLSDYLVDATVTHLVPEPMAHRYNLIPIFKVGNTITVAMANPRDINAIDKVRVQSKCEVEPVISTETGIQKAIDQFYGVATDIEEVIKGRVDAKSVSDQITAGGRGMGSVELEKLADAPPVIKLVNLIIMDAIKDKASDIHIEPAEYDLSVRYRIDGILHEGPKPPKEWAEAIISRIKILAKMDIAEKRKPQDGRIQIKMQGRTVDLRISSFPTVYGENIVMRILDTTALILRLEDIGMDRGILKDFDKMIRKPYGIVLVTGPTGSGKTTTLYAVLSTINSIEKNIITIEDPVEYHIKMVRQTQVNPKAGLTFASGLRSILRQDPDIIMVGEIRDTETAEIATHAALTGHLVFSTLHTNDAPGAVTRLIDMGIEPFLVSSSVIGVLAQRLVRLICEKCKEKIAPDKSMLASLGITKDDQITEVYRGKGCNKCKKTGYSGRTGIYELLVINEDMRKLIGAKATADEVRKKAIASGMRTLRDDGIAKVRAGVTTLEEVLKATQE